MKKAIVLFILFALILAAGITEHFFVHKTFEEFNDRLSSIENAIDSDDTAGALEQTQSLQRWWHDKKKIIEMISYCPDCRQVNVIIGELQGSLEIDDLENASSKIVSLYQLIENISDMLDFNAQDII